MKNNSNIYDIDGNLIREIDDVHTWTIEETQAKIDEYKEKLKELEENDPENSKIAVYRTYIANLHKYLFELYSKMSPEEIQAALNASKAKEDTKEQINNAINELKKEIENETEDTTETDNEPERTEEATGRIEDGAEVGEEGTEDQPRTQDDLLVSGEGRPETVMDEYVDFEEV